MAWLKASKECAMSGCHRTVAHGQTWCEQHRKEGEESRKPFVNAKVRVNQSHYRTKQWRRIRAIVLKRDPLCVACGTARSRVADHIVARKHGGTDELSNLQGLCHHCHNIKTARGE